MGSSEPDEAVPSYDTSRLGVNSAPSQAHPEQGGTRRDALFELARASCGRSNSSADGGETSTLPLDIGPGAKCGDVATADPAPVGKDRRQDLTDLGDRSDEARALVLQADGKIVAAGSLSRGLGFGLLVIPRPLFALVRYNVDGSRDATFGTAGVVLSSFGDTVPSVGGPIVIALTAGIQKSTLLSML